MSETNNNGGATGKRAAVRLFRKRFLRMGLTHFLWAHGYQVRRIGAFWLIRRVENPSEASRAERAIYEELAVTRGGLLTRSVLHIPTNSEKTEEG